MHPDTGELVALRDGEAPPEVAEHVRGCPACAAELERLDAVRRALAGLPEERPARDVWLAVHAAALQARQTRRLARAGWAAAALAAVFTAAVTVRGVVETIDESRAARATNALVAQSQQLEAALQAYQARDRVMTGWEASAVSQLEDRLATLDSRLTRDVESSRDSLPLWQERVELLQALVEARAGRDDRPVYAGL
jgi:anti-sigma factor RsiW